MIRLTRPDWALASAVALIAAALRLSAVHGGVFTSDAADYEHAAQAGVWRLYTDQNSATLCSLIGLRANQKFRAAPWDYLERRGDNASLRHFHVPAVFYLIAAVRSFSLSETYHRAVFLLLGSFSCGLLVLVLTVLEVSRPLCICGGILAAVDQRLIHSAVEPSPHGLYLFVLLGFFLLVSLRMITGRKWLDIPATVAVALLSLTFELAPGALLAVGLSVAIGMHLTTAKAVLCRTSKLIGVYIACIFLLWPGGILRGSFATCYGVMLGNVVLKRDAYYASTNGLLHSALAGRLLYGILLILMLYGGAVAVRVARSGPQSTRRLLVLFGSYASITLLFGISGRFVNDTYISHVLISLLLVGCFSVHLATIGRARWLSGLTCGLLLLAAAMELIHRPAQPKVPTTLDDVVLSVRTIQVPASALILMNDMNDAATMRLYLQDKSFELSASRASVRPRHPDLESRVALAIIHPSLLDKHGLEEWDADFETVRTFGGGKDLRVLSRRRPHN